MAEAVRLTGGEGRLQAPMWLGKFKSEKRKWKREKRKLDV
jgi:hypothetical protein